MRDALVRPARSMLAPRYMAPPSDNSEAHKWPLLIILYTAMTVGLVMTIAVVLM